MENCGNIHKNLEFLMLVGKLKHLKRTGWVKRNIPDCESVAGHMYRMSVMAFLLDDSPRLGINKDRCIKMALVHDIAECIVGDLTPFCGVSIEEKHKREVAAMERLSSLVGKETGEEIFNLFMEYEKQETLEAKAVKDLDKYDMILQAFEYELEMKKPNFLQDFFDNTEGKFQTSTVLNWVEELKKYRNKANKDLSIESGKIENEIGVTVKATPKPELTLEEIKAKLRELLENNMNEEIFDWIDTQISATSRDVKFIRALAYEVHKKAISDIGAKCVLDIETLKKRAPLLNRYIDHNGHLELQTLYEVQQLMIELNQPKGVLRQIFDILYDEDVIREENFLNWQQSNDPNELNGKAETLLSVRSFFLWLREAESSEDVSYEDD